MLLVSVSSPESIRRDARVRARAASIECAGVLAEAAPRDLGSVEVTGIAKTPAPHMAERLFLFLQMEFPWALGPADGRYVLRGEETEGPERVVVFDTVGAPRRRGRVGARRPQTTPDPTPVATARATVIDPAPLSEEARAQAWLTRLDAEREASAAAATLNRVLFAHRIAAADPHVHEVSPAQALVVRAGWGEGEQVAYGRWLHARELVLPARRSRRSAALRSDERFAALLGAREAPLLCAELALRARLDLDAGRPAHAALELDHAYTAALSELAAGDRPDLAPRVAELTQLRPSVVEAAGAAFDAGGPGGGGESNAAGVPDEEALGGGVSGAAAFLDEEAVRHALSRLEAALRARSAAAAGSGKR